MPIVEVWIAMGEDGLYGVGNDEDTAIEHLVDESGDDLAGSMCRVVKLNTFSQNRFLRTIPIPFQKRIRIVLSGQKN